MSYVIPPHSHRIPVNEAENMIDRYQQDLPKILNPDLLVQNVLPYSETFNKEHILRYLSRPEVACFRIYYGMKPDMTVHAIIVGVDKSGKDIVPTTGSGNPGDPDPDPDGGLIFEDAQRCPSSCPPPGGPFTKYIR